MSDYLIVFEKVEQMKKIRIGNVLKSADVGTLFSRRNSENTSHTHAQWAFIAQNGMEKAPKSTVFSTIFNNGNLYMTIRQPRIHF